MIQFEKKKIWDYLVLHFEIGKKEVVEEHSNSKKKCASFSTTYSQYYQRPKSINNRSHNY